MRQEQSGDRFLLKHTNPLPGILKVTEDIVITLHQVKCAPREMPYDLADNLPVIIVGTMKEIAQEDGARGLKALKKFNEPFGISGHRGRWYGQAGAAEVIDFPKVQVSQDERFEFRKEQGPVRKKLQGGATRDPCTFLIGSLLHTLLANILFNALIRRPFSRVDSPKIY